MIKEKIASLYKSTRRSTKLWVLAVVQVWVWPQLLANDMPLRIGFPLAITVIGMLMWNVISLCSAHDDEWGINR